MPKLSFSLVVKDSLQNVQRVIKSVRSVSDEIIILDTGSDDEVVEFEKTVADKLIQLPWNGNFAEMRNTAIEKSSGDWILTLDSDEEITEQLRRKIPSLIGANNGANGYRFKRIHYVDEDPPFQDYWTHLRLYRRNAHYVGAVHESIKNLTNLVTIDDEGCFILHHNKRANQRKKSLEYASSIKKLITLSEANSDQPSAEYYRYKLWVQENIYFLETDPSITPADLRGKYREYEKKRKEIEEKIRLNNWKIN